MMNTLITKFINIDVFVKTILYENTNIDVFFVTLIAGIFGFIIAAIPFTIQVLELKDNENIKKINENKVMRKKIFDRYFSVLKSGFWLFVFLLFLMLFSKFNLHNAKYINIPIIMLYILLAYIYLKNLYKLIKILRELVMLYLDEKGK